MSNIFLLSAIVLATVCIFDTCTHFFYCYCAATCVFLIIAAFSYVPAGTIPDSISKGSEEQAEKAQTTKCSAAQPCLQERLYGQCSPTHNNTHIHPHSLICLSKCQYTTYLLSLSLSLYPRMISPFMLLTAHRTVIPYQQ